MTPFETTYKTRAIRQLLLKNEGGCRGPIGLGSPHPVSLFSILSQTAYCRGLSNYQHHFEIYLRYMILWRCLECGTGMPVTIEAPKIPSTTKSDLLLVAYPHKFQDAKAV